MYINKSNTGYRKSEKIGNKINNQKTADSESDRKDREVDVLIVFLFSYLSTCPLLFLCDTHKQ